MKVREHKDALNEALGAFENCLEAPVVPGELPQWCRNATLACEEVASVLAEVIAQRHPRTFDQIMEEDPALAARIDEMRKTDEQLTEQMEQVKTYFQHLSELGSEIEPNEAKVEEQVEKAVSKGLEFVLAVRKQESAITTWYLEALERDRGTVD